jgi:peptidoglycan/LPS O-acetylase OafA/YrhL
MNKPTKYALLVLAIFAYTNVYWMESFFGVHLPGARTFIATAGVAIFVIIGSASARSVAWLTRKEFVFIGRVSYSLYLLHLVILVSLVHMLYGVIPLAWILVIAAASIFLVTALSYWGIEEPAMALGRRLTAKRGGGPPLSTPPASSQREVSQSGQAKP